MQLARKDFQGTAGVEIFNRVVKLGDALALSILLLQIDKMREKQRIQQPLDVHDIGGADGAMMLALLRTLNIQANITLNEPRGDRIELYIKKTLSHPSFFATVTATSHVIEDNRFSIPPQKELILASHVLYYNRDAWLTCASIQDHLFTKIFRSLQLGGVFSVVLQSSAIEHDGSHELWEDHIYPLLEAVKHSENKYYANSEEFDAALSVYRKQFVLENGCAPDWKINATVARSAVPIGNINTQTDANGKYSQEEEVLNILNFYLKGHDYNALTSEKQKQVLDILKTHFVREGQCEITHYNKVYTIEIGPCLASKLSPQDHARNTNVKFGK